MEIKAMPSLNPFQIRAPGRVFLFGEHSDYFHLQVISAALNLAIFLEVVPREDDKLVVNFQNLGTTDQFSTRDKLLPYRFSRDYLRSAFNVMKKHGFTIKTGATITVRGTIPIATGLSSSSALVVAAIQAFAQLAEVSLTKDEIARYAFQAEVEEFKEAGGMMDHLASTFGGVLHVDFSQPLRRTPLHIQLEGFVIGDSLEKKVDTVGDIKMIKSTVQTGYQKLSKFLPEFNHRLTALEEIRPFLFHLSEPMRTMTETTLKNRDLTKRAFTLLKQGKVKPTLLGELLDRHHQLLRDGLKRSTVKIERMIVAAKKAGALGAKMNGSGGGGTMLAYAPGLEKEVAAAIEREGGKAYRVAISLGVTITRF
ncbi:MAG: GHMP kinase [Candidatus Gerdarchaeota archaeon]|nr:MAG: GHMP kinase [Candidatus Gerdarchaeota archaeon]